jgi:hypothetical protein
MEDSVSENDWTQADVAALVLTAADDQDAAVALVRGSDGDADSMKALCYELLCLTAGYARHQFEHPDGMTVARYCAAVLKRQRAAS